MNKEELVNLNMKDIILDKWKGKLSYPFRQIDLEELENIINYYEEENNQLKEQYCERTDCTGRLGNSKKAEELIKENEKLKEENFNLREGIYIEKMSFPSEGRNFKELMNMPTYENLKKENEKLNHYKLLYQKVKERNDKAIERLIIKQNSRNIIASVSDVIRILKGNEE